jgi:hypothetical protein
MNTYLEDWPRTFGLFSRRNGWIPENLRPENCGNIKWIWKKWDDCSCGTFSSHLLAGLGMYVPVGMGGETGRQSCVASVFFGLWLKRKSKIMEV